MLYRRGAAATTGQMIVGPGNAEPLEVNFIGIEFAEPIAAAGGDIVVFKHDPFEFNNARTIGHVPRRRRHDQRRSDDRSGHRSILRPARRRGLVPRRGRADRHARFPGLLPPGRPGGQRPARVAERGNLDIQVTDAAGDVIAGFGANDATDDERIRIPAIAGQTYYLRVFANGPAINVYNVTVDNYVPPVPYDLELLDNPPGDFPPANSDTGRSQFDNVTRDNTPTIVFRLDDAIFLNDLPGNNPPGSPPDEVIPIPFQPAAGAAGYRVAIFDEGSSPPPGNQAGTPPQTPLGFATFVSPGVYQFTTPVLTDGSHFLTARVQMVDPAMPSRRLWRPQPARWKSSSIRVPPPAFFGLPGDPDDGLLPDSDTGVNPNPETLTDGVTSDTTPGFFGEAEAERRHSAVRRCSGPGHPAPATAFSNPASISRSASTWPSRSTAPTSIPNGYWQVDAINFNLNAAPFPQDGQRTIFLTAEDVAGNINPANGVIRLDIFIDTQGPQVTDVNDQSARRVARPDQLPTRWSASTAIAPDVILSTTPVTGLGANHAAGDRRPARAAGPCPPRHAVRPGDQCRRHAGPGLCRSSRPRASRRPWVARSPSTPAAATAFDFNPTNGLLADRQ